jgi:hypothetical protein
MYSFYQQIISHLQEYKLALTNDNVWFAVSGRLRKLLSIVSDEIIYILNKYFSKMISIKYYIYS